MSTLKSRKTKSRQDRCRQTQMSNIKRRIRNVEGEMVEKNIDRKKRRIFYSRKEK